jgi:hypothetical protein
MVERDVNSPVNTRNTASKLSGNYRGSSPGARSNPSARGDQATSQPPEQPAHRVAPHADQPSELKIHGPEE